MGLRFTGFAISCYNGKDWLTLCQDNVTEWDSAIDLVSEWGSTIKCAVTSRYPS